MKKKNKRPLLPRVVTEPLQMGEYNPVKHLITLDPSLTPRQHLDTLTHESLHAFCPWMDEEAVEVTATNICAVLWRAGYRRKK